MIHYLDKHVLPLPEEVNGEGGQTCGGGGGDK